MLDVIYAHTAALVSIWFTVAVTLSFLFGLLAEIAAQHGRKGPELVAATTVALLWPLALVGVLAFGLARALHRLSHKGGR